MKFFISLILLICFILPSHAGVIIGNYYAGGGGDSCSTDDVILGSSTSTTDELVNTNIVTSKYTATCSGNVASIIVRAKFVDGDMKAAIYTDTGTDPDLLVTDSAIELLAVDQAGEGDVTFTYGGSKPAIVKDTVYWVVVQSDDTPNWGYFGIAQDAGTDVVKYAKDYGDAMPADFDAQGYGKFIVTDIDSLRIRLIAE